jgi:hypothetical protein
LPIEPTPAAANASQKNRSFLYYYDRPREIVVDAVSLDVLLADQAVDVVIMDVEGSEFYALKGMQRILARARVLQVEFVPHHLTDVAGITVRDFLEPIVPHFAYTTIPSKGPMVPQKEIYPTLQAMFDRGEAEDGIVFHHGVP